MRMRKEVNVLRAADAGSEVSRHRVSARGVLVLPLLLDRDQSAAVLGVSRRTFEDLMDAEWMPKPVQLGQRLLRWSYSELQDAITRMPRRSEKQESVRRRIDRLKGET